MYSTADAGGNLARTYSNLILNNLNHLIPSTIT